MTTLIKYGNILKKKCPTDMPVKIRTVKMPYSNKSKILRDFGDSRYEDGYYLIRINNQDELHIQKDTLLHEWAHCMAGWDGIHSSHSKEWGICYAMVYRTMIEDLFKIPS